MCRSTAPATWPTSGLKTDVRALNPLIAIGDIAPIDELPEPLEPLVLAVLVLQVVRVLPHVDDEDRQRGIADVALMVEHLFHHEPPRERLPRQRAPAGALHAARGRRELRFEAVERPEPALDCGRELTLGPPA